MKLVTYRPSISGAPTVGVLVEDRVIPAASVLSAVKEDPAHAATMERFIQLPRSVQAKVARASADDALRTVSDAMSDSRLEAPVMRPSKIIGVGYNYTALCENEGVTPGDEPELFVKMPTSVTGPHDPVVVPKVIDSVDFEAELGVVIGTRCRNVSREEALDYVAGYTVINDVTAKIIPRPPEAGSVVVALKGPDTFCPTGPCLLTADEVPDPQNLQLYCRVNGEERQNFNSSDMVRTVAEIIAYVSERITLEPGDMFATGTSLGIGIIQKPPVFLEDGDVVECEIEGIGTIRNEFRLLHVRG
jgi:2-keto-4-pentenoate hydratase/2-oxohepta-3-ene-1,7-dioic acid hydratase in catechol pathway